MKIQKKFHKQIAIFFVAVLLPSIFPTEMFASNNGPMAPEASSFEPVDATDMVNLLSGDMSYVLPAMDVPSPEGGYPLALSYHAGIAMDQEASWLGLGWNLNPGAVNRSVNNAPDDSNKAKSIDFTYSNLGTHDLMTLGVGLQYKIFNLGLDFTFIDGKSTGGIVSYGFGIDSFKASQSVGFGANSGYTAVSLSAGGLGVSKTPDATSITFMGQGVVMKRNSVGVSMTGTSNQIGAGSFSVGFNSASNTDAKNVSSTSKYFNASIPIYKGINIKFGFKKTDYSMFDAQTSFTSGTLYFKDSYDINDNETKENVKTSFMDANSIPLKFYLPGDSRGFVEFSAVFPAYDNYVVSGQGNIQSIKPLLLESKSVVLAGINKSQGSVRVSAGEEIGGRARNRTRYHVGPQFANRFMDGGISNNKIHFYSFNTNSSFVEKSLGNWTFSQNPANIAALSRSESSSSVLNFNGETFSNYDHLKNRLKKETFIETFTNEQIIANPALIVEANNFSRTSLGSSVSKGIGAFKVTTLDGKTYHYSLPVYNYEMFFRSFETETGEDVKFVDKVNTQPFATHWLLTGVTGPDYVDTNSNGKLDAEDYGYWVTFDYGKWTDSFVWKRETASDKESVTQINPSRRGAGGCEEYNKKLKETTSRVVGIKQIYYLNSVNTRTHSALFVKSLKQDDVGTKYSKSSVFHDVDNLLVTNGDYATGVYFDKHRYNYDINLAGEYNTLKLDKIVLIKSEDKSQFDLASQQFPDSQSSSSVNIRSTTQKSNLLGQDLGIRVVTMHSRSWVGGTFKNNLYMNDNINQAMLTQKSLKSLQFTYGNQLSNKNGRGKLTLLEVKQYGRNNISVIPPYKFEYYNYKTFQKDNYDLWGFDKKQPENYSLKSITTPLGSSINVEYERDDFSNVLENLDAFKLSADDVVPDIESFSRGNNGMSGSVKMIWNNPCYAISEIFSCVKVGNQVSLNFIRNGVSSFTTQATITGINGDNVAFSVNSQLPSDLGNFLIDCQNRIKVNYGACDINEELIGKCDDSQGGLRVKNIVVKDDNRVSSIINYNYNNPGSSISSGIVADTPYVKNKYGFMFPAGVMYEYVTVSSVNNGGEVFEKNQYRFNVLKKEIDYQINMGAGQINDRNIICRFGQFYMIEADDKIRTLDVLSDNEGSNSVSLTHNKITDNTSKIGNIISLTRMNRLNHVLEKQEFQYLDSYVDNPGTYSEANSTYKTVKEYPITSSNGNTSGSFTTKYYVNTTNYKVIPAQLIKKTIEARGKKEQLLYDKYDFLTGQLTESRAIGSDGKTTKEKIIPAFVKYNEMGSKADNANYSNMLSQSSVRTSYLLENGSWKETSVGITTWSNLWTYKVINGDSNPAISDREKIWRKHKSFVWNGISDSNGLFLGYNRSNEDSFDWNVGVGTQPPGSKWKQMSEVTMYDHYSGPLESRDINGNFYSTKMGQNDTRVIASGNAGYNEMFYAGAENILHGYWLEPEVRLVNGRRDSNLYHTGKYSVAANSSTELGVFLRTDQHRAGRYKLSVWVHKANASKARVRYWNNSIVHEFNGESYIAGDWVLKTHYLDMSTGDFYAYINSVDSSEVYFDDFTLKPIASTVQGFVYNEWDELSYIIGNNGLATKFIYDNAGRLTKTFTEVIDDPSNSIVGGFKLISENKIKYKNLQ